VGMSRRNKSLIPAATIAVALVFAATPASAGQGGIPTEGSCGLGKSIAQEAIQDQTSPGATEAARTPPAEVGCTGNGP
jgi:hypothetical protein